MRSIRIIGPGRAGMSLALALERSGWEVLSVLGRSDYENQTDDFVQASHGVDVLAITTPDRLIGQVAQAIIPVDQTLVIHLSGYSGLEVLEPHPKKGSIHPAVTLPNSDIGAKRLKSGVYFVVDGDSMVKEIVATLGGKIVELQPASRTLYHAACCISANHLVALLGTAQKLADTLGVPFELFESLAKTALEDVIAVGPSQALTGPQARGDSETVNAHRSVLAFDELEVYDAMSNQAYRLANPEVYPCRY
ncbi:MAG: DUF2520 domain-containing protein [Actinobacteria bacterium]|nr:DUF2520 domain-containing protein [Actinomycetota bacterium]MCL6104935.1 DUF2520 domain-containing protein [Actinomycetota bacterium]